jgi:hypothetical protein
MLESVAHRRALYLALVRLQVEEKKLETITAKQGTNVEQFVQLVKQNRETVDKLKVSISHSFANTRSEFRLLTVTDEVTLEGRRENRFGTDAHHCIDRQ